MKLETSFRSVFVSDLLQDFGMLGKAMAAPVDGGHLDDDDDDDDDEAKE